VEEIHQHLFLYWTMSVAIRIRRLSFFLTISTTSGGSTATLATDVSRLPAQGYGTAFQLFLGKWTSAMNNLSSC